MVKPNVKMTKSCWEPVRVSVDEGQKDGASDPHHRLEADHVDKAVHDLCKRLGDNPRLADDDDLPIHTFLPLGALALERGDPPLLAKVVDVLFRALDHLAAQFDGELGEASLNVGVEGEEEE